MKIDKFINDFLNWLYMNNKYFGNDGNRQIYLMNNGEYIYITFNECDISVELMKNTNYFVTYKIEAYALSPQQLYDILTVTPQTLYDKYIKDLKIKN